MTYDPLCNCKDKKVIFETDMAGDVDDVGALALLLDASAKYGFTVAGISLNCRNDDTLSAVTAILASRGRTDIPVALCDACDTMDSRYLPVLASLCPGEASVRTITVPELYAEVFSSAKDGKVCIISVGFLQNLAMIHRQSPALFEQKVSDVILMGGRFEGDPEHREFNVSWMHGEEATYFSQSYRGRIIYIGWEAGAGIMTDLRAEKERTDPVVVAYGAYSSYIRDSWDPITVDFAVWGENEFYRLSPSGRAVFIDGKTFFTEAPYGNAAYVIFAVPGEEVGRHITEKIIQTLI